MLNAVSRMLEEVEGQLVKDEFEQALRLLEALEAQPDLSEEERLQSELKRLYVYLRSEREQETQLLFANDLVEKSQALGEPLYVIDALFHKSAVLAKANHVEESDELLLEAEKLVDSLLEESDASSTKADRPALIYRKAEIVHQKGFACILKADLDKAIKYLAQAIKLFKQITHYRHYLAIANLGLAYEQKGDLEKAMKYYRESQQLYEKIGNKNQSALMLTMIASLQALKGDMQQAIEVSEQSLALVKEGNGPAMTTILMLNGEFYWRWGDFETAKERLELGIQLEEAKPTFGPSLKYHAIIYLLRIAVNENDLEAANEYLARIQEFHEQDPNQIQNRQRYQLAKAIILKTSPRLRDRAQAEELLEQIINDEVVAEKITIDALLQQCTLLLYELRITGNPAVLEELKKLLTRLREIAQKSGSVWLFAETHVLQARLALVELNFKEVRKQLTQAQVIAQQHQMGRLSNEINQEYDMLMERLNRWEEFVAQKASLQERADILQVEALVTRMIYVRGTSLEDPLIRANVLAPESFTANEEIRLAIDLVNIGRRPGLAMRIEQVLPPRFTLIETQPEYPAEGGSVLLEGKLLGPMQTTSLSLRVRVEGSDSIELSPQVVYANLDGDFDVSHTKTVHIHPLLTFESDLAHKIFDYLVDAFRQDNVKASLRVEESGWRTRTQLLKDIPPLKKWHLYGSHGGFGSILQELLKHRIVELTTEAGKRSRKGHQTKLRIAYSREAVKKYVQQN